MPLTSCGQAEQAQEPCMTRTRRLSGVKESGKVSSSSVRSLGCSLGAATDTPTRTIALAPRIPIPRTGLPFYDTRTGDYGSRKRKVESLVNSSELH